MDGHFLIVGCGKMGSALVRGWQQAFPNLRYTIIDPSPLPDSIDAGRCVHHRSPGDLSARDFDLALLAVKPQVMGEIAGDLSGRLSDTVPILSIAAGKEISFYESIFGAARPIVRAMPNIAAAAGKSMTALCANKALTDKDMIDRLFQAVGSTVWFEDEDRMHAFTALTSSGLAYVFHMMESLAYAAEKAGFSAADAARIGRDTVIGAAMLADQDGGMTAESLRKAVTSPNGTTEAGLKILMGNEALSVLIEKTVQAATERSRELAKSSV